MKTLIFGFILFYGFPFGDLKLWNNGLSVNFKNQNSDFEEIIQNFLEYGSLTDLERQSETISNGRKFERERSKETNQLIIPLVLLFKMASAFFLSLIAAKLFLLKSVFGGKIALILFGVIFAREIRQFGMWTVLRNHKLYFEYDPGQYPTNEPDLSGYGYEYKYVKDLSYSPIKKDEI